MKKTAIAVFIIFLSNCSGLSKYGDTGAQSGVPMKTPGDKLYSADFNAVNTTANTADALATQNENDIDDLFNIVGVDYTVSQISGLSPTSGRKITVIDGITPCDQTTGGGSYISQFRADGSDWYCIGDGSSDTVSTNSIVGDDQDDGYIDKAILADLTYSRTSAPSSPVPGKEYPAGGPGWDPLSRNVTSGPDTIFAFADTNPDTITRSSGSFVTDGYLSGMRIDVDGSTSNDGEYIISSVVALTITLTSAASLTAESAGANITLTGCNHYMVVYGPDGDYYGRWTEMGQILVQAISGDIPIYAQVPVAGDPDTWSIPSYGWMGGIAIATAAGTESLPAAAEGQHYVRKVRGAYVAVFDPNGTEIIYLNGTSCGAGVSIQSEGDNDGEVAVFIYSGSGELDVDAYGFECTP